MTTTVAPDTSRIDRPWPEDGLEVAAGCAYCDAEERTLAHRDVQDWSFYLAPGRWNYWSCERCRSLTLSPRPAPDALALAYESYYTHREAGRVSLVQRLRERTMNEVWSHSMGIDLRPRLHLPSWLRWIIPRQSRVVEPFHVAELARLKPGRLLDVGCGNGYMLVVAGQLGWKAIGLEVDPAAVRAARATGLEVIEGSYLRLSEFHEELDCIVCSHVLEHVHEPRDLLARLEHALAPGGTLLLALPNATSVLREYFGDDWRGLEAPRHLSIPAMRQLEKNLTALGLDVRPRSMTRLWTAAESFRIRRRALQLSPADLEQARALAAEVVPPGPEQYDFIEFICTKRARGGANRGAS